MQWNILTGFLLVSFVALKTVDAIECYSCHNIQDSTQCKYDDPTLMKIKCSNKGVCNKIDAISLDNKEIVIRNCADPTEVCKYEDMKTKNGLTCSYCDNDLCNKSEVIIINSIVGISSLILVSILKSMF